MSGHSSPMIEEVGTYDATPLASRWAALSDRRGPCATELMLAVVKDVHWLECLQSAWAQSDPQTTTAHFFWPAVFSFNKDAVCLVLRNGANDHAAMQLRENHHVQCVRGQRGPLVYVSFLEIAPWNRADFARRQFHGLGSLLLQLASAWSVDRGLGGAVGLHALHDAIPFYEKLGFSAIDCPNEHHELYFELDAASASRFRQRGGLQ